MSLSLAGPGWPGRCRGLGVRLLIPPRRHDVARDKPQPERQASPGPPPPAGRGAGAPGLRLHQSASEGTGPGGGADSGPFRLPVAASGSGSLSLSATGTPGRAQGSDGRRILRATSVAWQYPAVHSRCSLGPHWQPLSERRSLLLVLLVVSLSGGGPRARASLQGSAPQRPPTLVRQRPA
jgi:hypothetical protein